jgi:hypothetical protein
MWMSNIKESKLAQSLFLPPNNYQVSKMPDVSAFSQSNMMQDMQKMQKLPKGQREKAMQNWKAEMMKKAKALKEQYGN